MADPLLTLCVITKDEERWLPGLLASVDGWVDEIVLVDSGSADRTVALAEAAGAAVVHRPWTDDFAAARNAALAHAHGRYVLALDADERLGPGAGAAIRAAVERSDFDVAMLPFFNATRVDASLEEVVSGAARDEEPVLISRLLRRTPDLRWTGRIHETVEGWIFESPRRMVTLDVPIVHYGYTAEVRAGKGKTDRDLRLLEAAVIEEPAHPMRWIHLAMARLRAQDPAPAFVAAERAWEAWLVRSADVGAARWDPTVIASVWAFLLLERRDVDRCWNVLERCRREGTAHPNIELLSAMAAVRRAITGRDPKARLRATEQARRAAGAAAAMRGRRFQAWLLPGATGAQAEIQAGFGAFLAADYERAGQAFSRALCDAPSDREAKLALIEVEIDAGRPANALQRLVPLLPEGRADLWLLAALATEALGRIDELPALLTAYVRAPGAPGSPHLPTRGAGLIARHSIIDALRRAGLTRLTVGPPQPRGGPGAGRRLVAEGERHAQAGRPVEAAAAFLAATRRDPWDALAWSDLGVVAHGVGCADAAAVVLELAVRLDPRDASTVLDLVAVQRSRGQGERARQILDEARRLLPDDEALAQAQDPGP